MVRLHLPLPARNIPGFGSGFLLGETACSVVRLPFTVSYIEMESLKELDAGAFMFFGAFRCSVWVHGLKRLEIYVSCFGAFSVFKT